MVVGWFINGVPAFVFAGHSMVVTCRMGLLTVFHSSVVIGYLLRLIIRVEHWRSYYDWSNTPVECFPFRRVSLDGVIVQ